MTEWNKKQALFVKDDIPTRLKNLADNLAKINSLSQEATRGDEAISLIRESKYCIEWIAPEINIDMAAELVDLQRTLSRWQFNWVLMWADTKARMKVAQEANTWSERVLRHVEFGI